MRRSGCCHRCACGRFHYGGKRAKRQHRKMWVRAIRRNAKAMAQAIDSYLLSCEPSMLETLGILARMRSPEEGAS